MSDPLENRRPLELARFGRWSTKFVMRKALGLAAISGAALGSVYPIARMIQFIVYESQKRALANTVAEAFNGYIFAISIMTLAGAVGGCGMLWLVFHATSNGEEHTS